MTNQLVGRLQSLASSTQAHFSEAVRDYAPKLRAIASDLEHKLEDWTSSVDHWVELHFTPEAEKLREEAGAAYRAAVAEAHTLIAEAKARL